jgi:hypothetical protein
MTEKQEVGSAEPLTQFVFAEGLCGLTSLLISNNPRAWGTFEAFIVPYATLAAMTDPRASPIEPWLFLAGAGALVVYDLKVDKTRSSESEIFKMNFAGMNAIGAMILTARYLAGDSKNDKKFSFTYAPGSHGGRLSLAYRF